jgi:sec-independent protein translocase protein TatB
VFGLSFGELCVLIVVAIVVIGPKDLPKVLRKMGQWAGKVRRMAADVRAQSGIDDVLRTEGLTKDLTEIRRLAQGDFLEASPASSAAAPRLDQRRDEPVVPDKNVVREREYPREGADGYGALPDTSAVYAQNFPPSPLATDPLYMLGDADAKMPEPAPAVAEDAPGEAKTA